MQPSASINSDTVTAADSTQDEIETLVVLEDCPWTLECWKNLPIKSKLRLFSDPNELISTLKNTRIGEKTVFVLDFYFDNHSQVNGAQVAGAVRSLGFEGEIYLSSLSHIDDDSVHMSSFSGRIPKDPTLATRQLGLA